MHSALSRREFLAQSTAATAVCLAARTGLEFEDAADPFAGFKMGIQSYSLRGFKVLEALKLSGELGLKFWETYPGHIAAGVVPKYISEQKEMLKAAGITLLSFGVVGFDTNEGKAREVFEFAKAMGIQNLSADPAKDKETFDLLDKLVEEYGVNIAIHNHGPGHRYDKIADVVSMVKDRHPRIGACVDTGHFLRSKESPVEAIEQLKGRVFGVHLKDVKDAKVFTIAGEGDLDILGCLKALRAQKFDQVLALEYEENPNNPMPDLKLCVQNVQAAMAKLPA